MPSGIKNNIVEASRMDATKRKGMAIEVMKELPPNTIMFMTGTGEGKEKPAYNALVQRIKELGLEDRVFLVGRVPDRLMGPLCSLPHGTGERQFRLATFLITSRMEGWGMAAQDSVVGGLPLVASKYTPVGTYLREKDAAAIVVDDDRASKFAECLRFLIDHPEGARAMAARGQEVTKDFTWKALTLHFAEEVARRLMLGALGAFPTLSGGE